MSQNGSLHRSPGLSQLLQIPLERCFESFLLGYASVMDATAISLCKENNLPVIIFNLNKAGNIRRVVTGEKIGSLVTA